MLVKSLSVTMLRATLGLTAPLVVGYVAGAGISYFTIMRGAFVDMIVILVGLTVIALGTIPLYPKNHYLFHSLSSFPLPKIKNFQCYHAFRAFNAEYAQMRIIVFNTSIHYNSTILHQLARVIL